MSLAPGARIGAYEITGQLGAGGMGEVYRARDTKLDREVAIKILPPEFATDAERVARFRREAKTLASISHPHIAHVHGLEETPDGALALVMELVEGEDLSQRLKRGPIPLDEALPIAVQIAQALEAAHEHGIIHRDLKPANIKVRDDGTVKVLDFGLAKAVDPPSGIAAVDLSQSPTITSPAMTLRGVILGTAAYMSPEQAKGKSVDRRADVWAYGCVLFEMVTGRRAFAGNDVSETLASILTADPDWTLLPSHTPASIRRVLRRCLIKPAVNRFSSMGDLRIELLETEEPPVRPAGEWMRTAALIGAGMVAIVSVGWSALPLLRPVAPTPVRLNLAPQPGFEFAVSVNDADVAISPDGLRLAYFAQHQNEPRRLFLRSLDSADAAVVEGSEDSRGIFFSPDGRWLGFVQNNNNGMRRVSVDGGAPIPICPCGGGSRGAAWLPDDTIVFSAGSGLSGLKRVAASGGEPQSVTSPDKLHGELFHQWPFALPDGHHILFIATYDDGHSAVVSHDLQTGTGTQVLNGASYARYSPTGHLIYVASGTLWAIQFDASALKVHGDPVALKERPLTKRSTSNAAFDVARNGTFAYLDGDAPSLRRSLVWIDRTGRVDVIPAPQRAYLYPKISPDGKKIALDVRDEQNDIWIWDTERADLVRFTFDAGPDSYPVWSHDGRRLVFSNAGRLFERASDGSGALRQVSAPSGDQQSYALTPDERQMIVRGVNGIALVSMSDGATSGLLDNVNNAALSPNGRLIAFDMVVNGRRQVFVRPFPDVKTGGWQMSRDSGSRAVWAHDGRELFFLGPDRTLMRVPVQTEGRFTFGTPELMFSNLRLPLDSTGRPYDISPDGKRFLFVQDESARENNIRLSIALHWAGTIH